MRSVNVRLSELSNVTIPIGFVGENAYTRVIFDCKKIYEDYPSAIAGLSVEPPTGDAYPAVVEKDGTDVVWDIDDSDVVYDGYGAIQLTFTVDEMVAKSYLGKIFIR